ncbi:cell division protein FtsQ/DivIB [Acetobacter okinawensis]|uniref:cell division protein FtsQ/DivIB n=1 Tax=Acetobacter okinawensis TaxID=1076594 RepID=UPI00209FD1E0|nr:cell division protein FtsQ/DivIB [Acetobacter okinawensis]MCP1212605.1 cell division protein FtsQ/DivIB [Acetobacter okinawensis]
MKRPASRPSRTGLFLKRQKRLLRPVIGLALLACAGTGVYLAVPLPLLEQQIAPLRDKVLGTSALRVTSIRVEGANLTSDGAIRAALNIAVGDPVLNFNVSRARENLNALPFIDHVSVERHLSGEIDVHITERPPYAVWQHQGHFILIDRQGQKVPDQGANDKDATAFAKLPLVVGDGANENAAALIDVLSQEPEVKFRVAAAVRVSDRRWNLSLKDGATVLLPEGEEAPAIHRLARINASTQLLDRPVVLIDMRLPDRLTIRERPPEPAPASTPQAGDTAKTAPPTHNTPGKDTAHVPHHAQTKDTPKTPTEESRDE